MDEETIDYKNLYEQVSTELEDARIAILTMRTNRGRLAQLSYTKVKTFIEKNYIVILVAIMLFTLFWNISRSMLSNEPS